MESVHKNSSMIHWSVESGHAVTGKGEHEDALDTVRETIPPSENPLEAAQILLEKRLTKYHSYMLTVTGSTVKSIMSSGQCGRVDIQSSRLTNSLA